MLLMLNFMATVFLARILVCFWCVIVCLTCMECLVSLSVMLRLLSFFAVWHAVAGNAFRGLDREPGWFFKRFENPTYITHPYLIIWSRHLYGAELHFDSGSVVYGKRMHWTV